MCVISGWLFRRKTMEGQRRDRELTALLEKHFEDAVKGDYEDMVFVEDLLWIKGYPRKHAQAEEEQSWVNEFPEEVAHA